MTSGTTTGPTDAQLVAGAALVSLDWPRARLALIEIDPRLVPEGKPSAASDAEWLKYTAKWWASKGLLTATLEGDGGELDVPPDPEDDDLLPDELPDDGDGDRDREDIGLADGDDPGIPPEPELPEDVGADPESVPSPPAAFLVAHGLLVEESAATGDWEPTPDEVAAIMAEVAEEDRRQESEAGPQGCEPVVIEPITAPAVECSTPPAPSKKNNEIEIEIEIEMPPETSAAASTEAKVLDWLRTIRDDKQLSRQDRQNLRGAILAIAARCQGGTGRLDRSIKEMASDWGMKEETVSAAMRRLEAEGYLRRVGRKRVVRSDGSSFQSKTCVWQLTVPIRG